MKKKEKFISTFNLNESFSEKISAFMADLQFKVKKFININNS